MDGSERRTEEVCGDGELGIYLQCADFRVWNEEDFGAEGASLVTAVDPLHEAIRAKDVFAGCLDGSFGLFAANYAVVLLQRISKRDSHEEIDNTDFGEAPQRPKGRSQKVFARL